MGIRCAMNARMLKFILKKTAGLHIELIEVKIN